MCLDVHSNPTREAFGDLTSTTVACIDTRCCNARQTYEPVDQLSSPRLSQGLKHRGMKVYLTHSPQYVISAHVQLLAICCCHGIGLKVDCIFGILHLGVPVLCFSTFTASQSNFKVWNKHHRSKKSQHSSTSMMQFCLQQGVIPMIAITRQLSRETGTQAGDCTLSQASSRYNSMRSFMAAT